MRRNPVRDEKVTRNMRFLTVNLSSCHWVS
jgi:hypothetical protein